MTGIHVKGVSKAYGGIPVLEAIDLVIPNGKTTVILGPSGTGKSVLLKTIVGLTEPDAGQVLVHVDGKTVDVTHCTREELFAARRHFGMLFQDAALFDSMSVAENVAFPMRRHTRWSEREIAIAVEDRLRSVGLAQAGAKFPSELSGGMRKRVGLARAIALDPDVVFFDEPSSGLDPVTASTIDDLILQMQAAKPRTFLVISHDLASTTKIADHVGMLFRGRLVEFGPKEQVLRSADPVVRQFLDRKSDGPIQIV